MKSLASELGLRAKEVLKIYFWGKCHIFCSQPPSGKKSLSFNIIVICSKHTIDPGLKTIEELTLNGSERDILPLVTETEISYFYSLFRLLKVEEHLLM